MLRRALERESADPFSWSAKVKLAYKDKVVLAEIPREINANQMTVASIDAWQASLRRVMRNYFSRGYVAVDFVYGDRCFYVLKKQG